MAKRRPRSKSISAWASYIHESGTSITQVISRLKNEEMKEWLLENIIDIYEAIEALAEDDSAIATATFASTAEVIDESEVNEPEPAKGERV